MNGAVLPAKVVLPGVRVVGITRTPADLTKNPEVAAGVTFAGNATIYATTAFYHKFAASVGSAAALVSI